MYWIPEGVRAGAMAGNDDTGEGDQVRA
jgi:hypothetical protein